MDKKDRQQKLDQRNGKTNWMLLKHYHRQHQRIHQPKFWYKNNKDEDIRPNNSLECFISNNIHSLDSKNLNIWSRNWILLKEFFGFNLLIHFYTSTQLNKHCFVVFFPLLEIIKRIHHAFCDIADSIYKLTDRNY